MVAAPETQQHKQEQIPSAAAASSTVSSAGAKQTKASAGQGAAGNDQATAQASENGVNGLTAVDSQAPSTAPAEGAAANLPPLDIARNIPCRYFPLGTCKYGDQCIFSHGVAGVAGSPGVPSTATETASVQHDQLQAQSHQQPQQLQHTHQQHVQHEPMFMQQQQQQEGYPQGMPFYYPQMMENGQIAFGYQPAFPPQQQGYYPFPPPFYQHHQHLPPHAYYQSGPPPPAQMVPESPAPALSPALAPTDQVSLRATSPSPEQSRALSPETSAAAPSTSPSATQQPLPLGGSQAFQQYQAQPIQAEHGVTSPTSPTSALGPEVGASTAIRQDRPASLHTFFQTGAGPSNAQPQQGQPQQAQNVPGPYGKGLPRMPTGMRRGVGGFGGGMPPFAARPKMKWPPGTPKPACSFFEANRCRNRDNCAFQHLLPDGSDARQLGLGWAGVDGRSDNLEERGGLPPAWLAHPKRKNGGAFHNGQNFNNGAYPVRDSRPRNRFDDEQNRSRQESQAPSQGVVATATNDGAPPAEPRETVSVGTLSPQQSADASPIAVNTAESNPTGEKRPPVVNGHQSRVQSSGAPQLVAAINGLTRRAPPASGSGAAQTSSNASAARPTVQRVPSGADFPALSAPEREKSPSRPASPAPAASASVASATTANKPTSTPAAEPAPTPANVPLASPAATSDHDFVMVNHSDAPVTPAPAPAPAPRVMGSFASAAARGASVVLPEKPKRVSVAPGTAPTPAAGVAGDKEKDTSGSGPNKKESSGGAKKGGKSAAGSATTAAAGGQRGDNKKPVTAAPVAVKA